VFNSGTKYLRTVNSAAPLNINFYLAALNTNGVAANYSLAEFRFGTYGDGLTDTQASNFYTAVQGFNKTLSRNV